MNRRARAGAAAVALLSLIVAMLWWSPPVRRWRLSRASTRLLLLDAPLRPGDYDLQMALGRRLERTGNPDGALEAYRRAAGARPDSAEALASAARAGVATGDLNSARLSAASALALDPAAATANRTLGIVAALQQDWLVAHDRLWKATRQDPRDVIAWERLAEVDLDTNRAGAAAQEAARALSINHSDAAADALLGHALLETGQLRAAAAALQFAVRAEPRDPEVWTYFGQVHMALHDSLFAEQSLKTAVSLSPRSVIPQFALGQLYEQEGKTADAIASYRKVLRLDPENEGALYRLSQVLAAIGDSAGARRFGDRFQRASDFHRSVTELQDRIGRLTNTTSPARQDLPALYTRLSVLYRTHGLTREATVAAQRGAALSGGAGAPSSSSETQPPPPDQLIGH